MTSFYLPVNSTGDHTGSVLLESERKPGREAWYGLDGREQDPAAVGGLVEAEDSLDMVEGHTFLHF